MPKTYWIFIPFPQAAAGDFAPDSRRVTSWEAVVPEKIDKNDLNKGKKRIVVLYADTPGERLAGAEDTDSVYVFGHGTSGASSIGTLTTGGTRVQAKEVARLLTEVHKLRPGFAGKVKAYTCDSAKSTDSFKSHCFAGQLASNMRNAGVKSAKYFGYDGGVDGYYTSLQERKDQINHIASELTKHAEENKLPVPKFTNNFNDLPFQNDAIHRWIEVVTKVENEEHSALARAKEVRVEF